MIDSRRQSSQTALATDVWWLWMDAIGGYRLMQGDQFTIGGPCGDDMADIAVRSSWRRRMALLSRLGDDFWLTTTAAAGSTPQPPIARRVSFDTCLPIDPANVSSQASQPDLRLHKPSPLSGTVLVTVEPPHRFVLPFDAMLLVDKTILIGSECTAHIRATQCSEPGIVLAKRTDGWWLHRGCGTAQRLLEGERTEVADLAMTIRRETAVSVGEKR